MSVPAHTDRMWFSINEAAEWVGVTDRTIRNFIARGSIKAHRVKGSRMVRIQRTELAALMTEIPAAAGVGHG